jgi:hypothetical protein
VIDQVLLSTVGWQASMFRDNPSFFASLYFVFDVHRGCWIIADLNDDKTRPWEISWPAIDFLPD